MHFAFELQQPCAAWTESADQSVFLVQVGMGCYAVMGAAPEKAVVEQTWLLLHLDCF